MATKQEIRVEGGYLVLKDQSTEVEINFPLNQFRFENESDVIYFIIQSETSRNSKIYSYNYDEILLEGIAFNSVIDLISWLRGNTGIQKYSSELNTAPSFDLFFSEATNQPTTLLEDAVIDERFITVLDPSVFEIGTWIGIFSGEGRYIWCEVVDISGNVLELDSFLDYSFPAGSNVLPTNRNLAVDGSTSRRIFSIQAGASGLSIDTRRLIISMITNDKIELNLFGDQPRLKYGLLLRKVDGEYRNLINTKTNYEIGVHSYDLSIYESSTSKPNDLNALLARSTWSGESKRGTIIRLNQGEELQLVVSDNLEGFVSLLVLAQGSEHL